MCQRALQGSMHLASAHVHLLRTAAHAPKFAELLQYCEQSQVGLSKVWDDHTLK